eukprot:641384-Lingulodinium_polyedra.AAC.1
MTQPRTPCPVIFILALERAIAQPAEFNGLRYMLVCEPLKRCLSYTLKRGYGNSHIPTCKENAGRCSNEAYAQSHELRGG